MLESYWGFRESPFRSGHRADWFYASASHDEALARLFYLIEQVHPLGLLAGPEGVGKSQLLSVVRQQSRRTQRKTVFVDATGLDEEELLWQIAGEFQTGPAVRTTRSRLWWELTEYLRGLKHANIQSVLLIDHFDDADPECKQTVRRLLHATRGGLGSDSNSADWLTVLLALRSEENLIRCPDLLSLADLRIPVEPLTAPETADYVTTRLARVGYREPIFDQPALDALYAFSQGIPRRIDRLAHLSLMAAMGEGQTNVDRDMVLDVAHDLIPSARPTGVAEV